MKIISMLRQVQPIKRNLVWWATPLPVSIKLRYYPSMAIALVKSLFTKNRTILYLGHKLHYDNLVTPLSLQAYPYEISRSILDNTPEDLKIRNVLDIGGNIGQFSLTLSYFLDDNVHIDVLEPNPDIFDLIRKNTARKLNIAVHNFGVGKPSTKYLFYTPGKSATGSIFSENATIPKKIKKTEIKLIDDVSTITKKAKYDLVKIDVEGYEYDLLQNIKPLKTRLMFVEVSSLGRYKDFFHSELFSLIEKKFGRFDILHLSSSNVKSDNFDILIQF